MRHIKTAIKRMTRCLAVGGVQILTYHNISNDSNDPLAVSPEMFDRQMSWLSENGYIVLPLDKALSNIFGKKTGIKSIVLTFDDGFTDFLDMAEPILRRHSFPATVFVVAGEIGGTSWWRKPNLQKPLMDWESLRKVVDLGYEIGSHGLHHCDLSKLSVEQLQTEVCDSKEILEQKLKVKIESFAYPWGCCTSKTAEIVRRAGYRSASIAGSGWRSGFKNDIFHLRRKVVFNGNSWVNFKNEVQSYL